MKYQRPLENWETSESTSVSEFHQFLEGNFFVEELDFSTFVLLVRAACGWRWVRSIGGMILTGASEVLEWTPVLMPVVQHKFNVELPGTEPGSSRWKPGNYPLNHGLTLWRLKWIHILHQNSVFASNRRQIKVDLIRIRECWDTDWADGVFRGLDWFLPSSTATAACNKTFQHFLRPKHLHKACTCSQETCCIGWGLLKSQAPGCQRRLNFVGWRLLQSCHKRMAGFKACIEGTLVGGKRTKYVLFCILSFGWFPGVWILCADVSEYSVPYSP